MDLDRFTFRAASGPWLAGAIMALAAFFLGDVWLQGGVAAAGRWGPGAIWAGLLAWAVFWAPTVVVDQTGVCVRNIVRSFDVPWAAISLIDTKYSLVLVTPGRKITAWAAPAPSRRTVRHATPDDVRHLPESTYGPGGSVRPGDLASAPSGQLAIVLRERWEALRDSGQLAGDANTAVGVRWHRGVVAALAGLGALALGAGVLLS